jgi:hypothetical protein
MFSRKGLVRGAALAALCAAGWARAEGTPRNSTGVKAQYLQTQAQPPQVPPDQTRGDAPTPITSEAQAEAKAETPPRPLMSLLRRAGVGETLDEAKINVFGHVEGSWTHNFSSGDRFVVGRAFDLENDDPTLNQLDLTIERPVVVSPDQWDLGGRVEWIWGGDPRLMHSVGLFDYYGFDDGPDNQFDLNQAYIDINVPVGKGLRVRAGKFVTLLGYEVINPTGNPLYSHSYLFGYAVPFTHTGVLGTYQATDKLAVNAGVTRGWDTALEDNNDTLDFLGGLAYTVSDRTSLTVNLVTGPDQPGDNGNWRSVLDLIVSHKLDDNTTVVLNGDYGYEANSGASVSGSDAQWYGLAGYLQRKINDSCTLNGRLEYFNDQDGARVGGTATSWYEATAGVALRPFPAHDLGQNLVIRPEVRFDYAEDPVFNGDYNQFTFGIDAYFTF